MTPTQFFSDDALGIWNCPSLVIIETAGLLSVEHMRKIAQGHQRGLTTSPKGVVGLTFLRAGTPVASSEARAESARFVKDMGPRLVRNALVVEERGVGGALMRTAIRGINVVTRNRTLVVYDTAGEAIRAVLPLIASLTGTPLSEREVADAVKQAREQYRERGERLSISAS